MQVQRYLSHLCNAVSLYTLKFDITQRNLLALLATFQANDDEHKDYEVEDKVNTLLRPKWFLRSPILTSSQKFSLLRPDWNNQPDCFDQPIQLQ